MTCTTGNEAPECLLPKLSTLSKSVELLSSNHVQNMTDCQHIITVCGQLEVADDDNSSQYVKTIRTIKIQQNVVDKQTQATR